MGHFLIEEWREFVPEFKTKKKYFVSNHGNLKTRVIKDGVVVEKQLKGSIIDGYRYIGFTRIVNGERKTNHFSFHYIVGLVFLERDSKKHTNVIHLDYDRMNNVVSNLQWATRKEMLDHAKKSPYVIEAKKKLIEFNRQRDGHKLTVNDVKRLKAKIFDPNRKTRYKILAKQFGISEMQLYRIKSGENWGHIKVDLEQKG